MTDIKKMKLMTFYIYLLSNHLNILALILIVYNSILLGFLSIKYHFSIEINSDGQMWTQRNEGKKKFPNT